MRFRSWSRVKDQSYGTLSLIGPVNSEEFRLIKKVTRETALMILFIKNEKNSKNAFLVCCFVLIVLILTKNYLVQMIFLCEVEFSYNV